MKHFTHNTRAVLVALVGLLSGWAEAQTYPARPIQVIAPSTAGGGFDLVGRVLASKLSDQMGQQFVVENKPGSGTLLGTQSIAKSVPDGYHLLVGGLSNMALNVGLYKQPGYDPVNDFVPIRLVVSHSYTLIATQSLAANSLKDVFALAKAQPGKLTIGSSGPGSGQFILATLLKNLGKIDLLQVPYKGAQPVYMDLIAGRVDLFFDNSTTTRTYLESGQVKGLAVSSHLRAVDAAQIPTLLADDLGNPRKHPNAVGIIQPQRKRMTNRRAVRLSFHNGLHSTKSYKFMNRGLSSHFWPRVGSGRENPRSPEWLIPHPLDDHRGLGLPFRPPVC